MLNEVIAIKTCIVKATLLTWIATVLAAGAATLPVASAFEKHDWKCVAITVDICNDIDYNVTISMDFSQPNKITGKTSQVDSKAELELFQPLLQAKKVCSPDLRLFLCSIYIPFCSVYAQKTPITSCKPLCESVKSRCSQQMEAHGLEWPKELDCKKLPEQNHLDKAMCLDGGVANRKHNRKGKNSSARRTRTSKRTRNRNRGSKTTLLERNIKSRRTYCRIMYLRNNNNYFYVEKLQTCALKCLKDGLFTFNEKQIVEKCLSALSCVCGLLCILALAVVVFEYQHTCYPERTIVFITVCYLFYALAYIIRIIYSREGVTCKQEGGQNYLLVDGSGNLSCASTFLLTYCFSVAQNIWWVMLCFSWFLRAGLKWRSDLIRALSMYFHIFSWGVPCAMTVIVLVIRKIDVNELTGICFIGNRHENLPALRAFVLGPLFTFLTMGIVFLLFGFIALFRINSNGYHSDDPPSLPNKLETPLLPVGIYAALHAFFSSYIFASYFYEYANKTKWYRDPTSEGPNFQVFLMRVIMDFAIGICAALWLLLVHFPRCLRRKLYHTSSGLTDMSNGHSAALTVIKTHRMDEFSAVANTTTENTTLTSMKSRVDTSETSI